MNLNNLKPIIISLVIFSVVILIFILMGQYGLPFPSSNPDGFERAVFGNAGVEETENILGIDLGAYTDFILGPLGIVLAFVLSFLVLKYLTKKS